MAAQPCATTPSLVVEIQLRWRAHDLDPAAAIGRRLILAVSHRRLPSVALSAGAFRPWLAACLGG